MSIALRDYQEEAVELVMKAWQENKAGRELLVLPTGAGKTICFAEIARRLAEQGVLTLILAHRDDLLDQAIDKYKMIRPEAIVGKVKGSVNELGGEVTVASVASAKSPKRIKAMQQFNYGLIVVDEAHHAAANSYQAVLQAFPDAFVLYVTATPDRLDGKPVIDKQALYTRTIVDMVREKHLCPPKAIAIKTEISLDEIKTTAGDFNERELSDAVDTPARNKRIVNAYQEHAAGMPSIAFCVTVEHAESLAYTFNDHGIPASVVTGKTSTDDRKQMYADLRSGAVKVLVSIQVLTEGFDEPCVQCVIMARPTKSRALYVQCLDEKTEILTPSGFKTKDQIKQGDLVAAFDKETEHIQWLPALSKVERMLESDEQMYALKTPAMDIRVTGGHRMLYRVRTDKAGHRGYNDKTEWMFLQAQGLYNRTNGYEIPIAGTQEVAGVPLTDDELRFIGWFITDGTLNRITNQISIYQAAHQPHHDAIKSCLEGCGFKYGVSETIPDTKYNATSNRIRYTISKGTPRGTDKHLTGWGRLAPYIDKNLSLHLDNITERQLDVLLEAIHLGDGAKQLGQDWTRQSYHVITGNLVFAERLQSLCVRRGYKCNIAMVARENNPAYMIHIKKTTFVSVGGKLAYDRPHFQVSPTSENEIVWCVENRLGTLVTRRNGKVAIVGNCVGRGARLFPGKEYFLILDITDNCLKHRLTPHNLNKALGLRLNDDETIEEAEAREIREAEEKEAQIRKLRDKREKDILVNLLQTFDWQKRADGVYILEFGHGHKMALKPEKIDAWNPWEVPVYSVWWRHADDKPQKWSRENLPLTEALQFAEARILKIQDNPRAIKLYDKTATWLHESPTDAQRQMALWYRIEVTEDMTKGELSTLIDQAVEAKKARKKEKEERKLSQVER